MDFSESVLEAVKAVMRKFPGDLERQKTEAVKAIKKLPDYAELIESLVTAAVHDIVYDLRHTANGVVKKEAGQYGEPAKVVSGLSQAVNDAAASVYLISIAGKALGDIYGKELKGIAADQGAIANGHLLNRRLCLRLAKIVPEEKQIREAVSEKRLRALIREVQRGKVMAAA